MLAAFFAVAIAFMLAGAAAAVLNAAGMVGWYGHWLALHLVLLGGVSQLILGAGQFFSTAFLATDPPGRRMAGAQLASWSAGAILVAVGVSTGHSLLTDIGGAAVIAALGLFATALWQLERRSLQRARWAIRWYYACAASLGLGAVIGIAMARGADWPYGSLLGAHLALNLAGWLGTAIVGTLHTFYPSLTQTRLRRPRLQRPTFVAWTTGVAVLAYAYAFDVEGAVTIGWTALTIAALLLVVNVGGCARAAERPLSLAARLVRVGQAFLLAGLLVALVKVVGDGPYAPVYGTSRNTLAVLLLAGWVGLTVAGSLLQLLGVLHRVRDFTRTPPGPTPTADLALTTCAATALGAFALSGASSMEGLRTPAVIAVVAVACVIAVRILTLAARVARSGRTLAR